MASRDPERYFDRRTVKRHLKRGVVSEADHDRYLAGLPDLSDKIKPRDDGGDDDGYDHRTRAKAVVPLVISRFVSEGSDDDDDDDDDDFDDDDDTAGDDDASA